MIGRQDFGTKPMAQTTPSSGPSSKTHHAKDDPTWTVYRISSPDESGICSLELSDQSSISTSKDPAFEKMLSKRQAVYPAGSQEKTQTADLRYTAAPADALDRLEAGKGTLGLGTKGPAVKELQELMIRHGASFEKKDANGKVVKNFGADGYYGAVTTREVEKLQEKWGLGVTGRLDAPTLARLREEPGSADSAGSTSKAGPKSELEQQLANMRQRIDLAPNEISLRPKVPQTRPLSEREQLEADLQSVEEQLQRDPHGPKEETLRLAQDYFRYRLDPTNTY